MIKHSYNYHHNLFHLLRFLSFLSNRDGIGEPSLAKLASAKEFAGACELMPADKVSADLASVDGEVDVTLVQTVAGNEVARETATLAYVAGAGGGPITVRALAAPERELVRLQAPRVYAYDPAWLGEVGDSGYDIAWPQYSGLKIILR